MDFSTYQIKARKTAIYPDQGKLNGLLYTSLGLAGEAGEFCNKVKKVLRDNNSVLTEEKVKELGKELGGLLWYFANTATELGLNTDDIAKENLDILYSRQERGVLKGSGDNR